MLEKDWQSVSSLMVPSEGMSAVISELRTGRMLV